MRSIRRNARRVAAATVASGMLAAGALALTTPAAGASTIDSHQGTAYSFRTIDDPKDVTFNQLLGINDLGEIAGYFGSGAQNHPNKGYLIPPFASHFFSPENFPHSVQTQVTGLNNRGVTVGFASSMNNASMVNDNHGFVDVNGHFRTTDYPTHSPATPPADQNLGAKDNDDAGAFNDEGDVAGFYTNSAGTTDGFLKTHHGQFIDLAAPGAASTMALGVSSRGEVVGVYTVGSGAAAVMHGFTWTGQHGFRTVDDPHGIGTTTVNGVNDLGQLVGFYVDGNGNTDGFAATPQQ